VPYGSYGKDGKETNLLSDFKNICIMLNVCRYVSILSKAIYDYIYYIYIKNIIKI